MRYLTFCLSLLLACGPPTKDTPIQETVSEPEPFKAFIGTYTSEVGSEGVYSIPFDRTTGTCEPPKLVVKATNPSYLVFNKQHTLMLLVNETADGRLASYQLDTKGIWQQISSLPVQGDAPCHIDISPDEQLVAVANYMTGNIVVYPLSEDGALGTPIGVGQHEGTGPNTGRQEGPHAHYVQFSPDGQYLYAVDLGIDQVKVYPIEDNQLGTAQTALRLQPGDGPRHIAFHPTRNLAFVVNELSNTIASTRLEDGMLVETSRISTLPDEFEEHSQCAAIKITSDGRHLYASNRGHNSVAAFEVQHNGELKSIGITSTEGNWPRDISFSPNEQFLLVANQESNEVKVFEREPNTGQLTYTGNKATLASPVCIAF